MSGFSDRSHALQEGATQWLTVRTLSTGPLAQTTVSSDMYPMNVELVDRLVRVVGEDVFLRAYFQGHMAEFISAVEECFGADSFQNLVTLSDLGLWRETFRYLAVAQNAVAETKRTGRRALPVAPADGGNPAYLAAMNALIETASPDTRAELVLRRDGATEALVRGVETTFGPGSAPVVDALMGLGLWAEMTSFMNAARAAVHQRGSSAVD